MAIKIEGQHFSIGDVTVTEGAFLRAEALQARRGRKGQEAVYVHTSVLLKLHATGQWGNIVKEDRVTNRINIARSSGRVLSVIGDKEPFVIMTELRGEAENKTTICIPEEVV